ncbi:hypothetical protein V5799_004937 [Amblyomma americanum]|uniref:Peptidase M13 C-terminal domain-containing protein n=1 Tax=Amblyomma americanum TaxID=6943 RepID=A0AAQ4D4P4_AMBAM
MMALTQPPSLHCQRQQAVLQWLEAIPSQPVAHEATDNDTTLLRMPAELMAACLRKGSRETDKDAETAIHEFLKSMAVRDFSWPSEERSYPADNYSAPMQALVDLAYRWNLPLWFRLDLLPPNSYYGRKRTLYMTPSPMADLIIRLQSRLMASGMSYATYLSLLDVTVLNLQSIRMHFGPSFRHFLESDAAAQVQSDVLRNLSAVSRSRHPLPRVVKIGSLPYSLKGLEADDWKRLLQRATGADPPISEEDSLTVSNHELVKTSNILFRAYSPKDILYHTSWWLLQVMGPLVSDELFALVNANDFGETVLNMYCAVHVEATYHVLLAMTSQSRFADVERLLIGRHLQNVRSITLERLGYASGLGAEIKHALTSALERTDTVIWPDKLEESSREWLVLLHGRGYSGAAQGFFSKWFTDRVRFQEALAAEERVLEAKTYRLDVTRTISFIPALQSMAVSVATLSPPFYYAQGTNAMFYAGLGFLYARELFQALSSTAELLKGTAGGQRRLDVSAVKSSEATFWESFLSCPPGVDKSTLYPDLPALHVAYEAYVRFRNYSGDAPLKGPEWYSPEQVFFLTFCHATCEIDSSGRLMSQYCNAAARNYAPFAAAFSCSSESNMNPEDKCEYF